MTQTVWLVRYGEGEFELFSSKAKAIHFVTEDLGFTELSWKANRYAEITTNGTIVSVLGINPL